MISRLIFCLHLSPDNHLRRPCCLWTVALDYFHLLWPSAPAPLFLSVSFLFPFRYVSLCPLHLFRHSSTGMKHRCRRLVHVTASGPSPVGFPPKQQRFDATQERLDNILYSAPADRTTAPLLTLHSYSFCFFYGRSISCWLIANQPAARANERPHPPSCHSSE